MMLQQTIQFVEICFAADADKPKFTKHFASMVVKTKLIWTENGRKWQN